MIQANIFRSAMRTQMVMGGSSSGVRHDELAEWLVQPPVPTDDPLRWWLANRNLYPRLAQMAIDIHIIPGMCSCVAFLSVTHHII